MAEIINRRVSAEIPGEFAVFLIGVRINKPWNPSWLPVFTAMPKMLKELSRKPELGLLHYRLHFGLRNAMVIQYWQSFERLHAYAHARESAHLPAWAAFNKAIGTNGAVGIWHETYKAAAGSYENIFVNMPRYGVGMAGDIFDSGGKRNTARQRLSQGDETQG